MGDTEGPRRKRRATDGALPALPPECNAPTRSRRGFESLGDTPPQPAPEKLPDDGK